MAIYISDQIISQSPSVALADANDIKGAPYYADTLDDVKAISYATANALFKIGSLLYVADIDTYYKCIILPSKIDVSDTTDESSSTLVINLARKNKYTANPMLIWQVFNLDSSKDITEIKETLDRLETSIENLQNTVNNLDLDSFNDLIEKIKRLIGDITFGFDNKSKLTLNGIEFDLTPTGKSEEIELEKIYIGAADYSTYDGTNFSMTDANNFANSVLQSYLLTILKETDLTNEPTYTFNNDSKLILFVLSPSNTYVNISGEYNFKLDATTSSPITFSYSKSNASNTNYDIWYAIMEGIDNEDITLTFEYSTTEVYCGCVNAGLDITLVIPFLQSKNIDYYKNNLNVINGYLSTSYSITQTLSLLLVVIPKTLDYTPHATTSFAGIGVISKDFDKYDVMDDYNVWYIFDEGISTNTYTYSISFS